MLLETVALQSPENDEPLLSVPDTYLEACMVFLSSASCPPEKQAACSGREGGCHWVGDQSFPGL